MKPYNDNNCKCHEIEEQIYKDFPKANWNYLDEACEAWQERSSELEDNSIEFEDDSEEGSGCKSYGCICPTCGRKVCWLCA